MAVKIADDSHDVVISYREELRCSTPPSKKRAYEANTIALAPLRQAKILRPKPILAGQNILSKQSGFERRFCNLMKEFEEQEDACSLYPH
jgi:hypothetical protein